MRPDFAQLLLLAVTLAAAGCAARAQGADVPAAGAVNPFVNEDQCRWWMSEGDGRALRASIDGGYSGEDPVLTIADPAFLQIDESSRPKIILRIDGKASRAVRLEAWSTHVGSETAMLGMYLTARARRKIGMARRIEIVSDGTVLLDLAVAATPSTDDLNRCVFPKGKTSDSE